MESMLKSMKYNPNRAKALRYLNIEHLRSTVTDGQKDENVPDSMVILHFSTRQVGQKDFNSTLTQLDVSEKLAGNEGGEMRISLLHVIDVIKRGDELLTLDPEKDGIAETRITAVSLIHGIKTRSSAVDYGEGPINGTMVNTTFVDGSLVTFLIKENGKIGFIGSTHELPIKSDKINLGSKFDSDDLQDVRDRTGKENVSDLIEDTEDEQYFAEALLSVISSTPETFQEVWGD